MGTCELCAWDEWRKVKVSFNLNKTQQLGNLVPWLFTPETLALDAIFLGIHTLRKNFYFLSRVRGHLSAESPQHLLTFKTHQQDCLSGASYRTQS